MRILFSIVTILSLIFNVCCDSDDENTVSVPLKLGEREYTLTFPATHDAANEMARKFCKEKGEVESESGLNMCTQRLSQHLSKSVDNEKPRATTTKENIFSKKEEVIKVSLGIGGKVFDFEFEPDLESTNDAAKKFCVSQLETLNIQMNRLHDCVQPVEDHLKSIIRERKKK